MRTGKYTPDVPFRRAQWMPGTHHPVTSREACHRGSHYLAPPPCDFLSSTAFSRNFRYELFLLWVGGGAGLEQRHQPRFGGLGSMIAPSAVRAARIPTMH
jgi:hypothetical protein